MFKEKNNLLQNLRYQTNHKIKNNKSKKKIEEFNKQVEIKKDYQKIYDNLLKEFTDFMQK